MNPWRVILATLVIFTTGLITGGLMVKKFSAPKPPNWGPVVEAPKLTPTPPLLMRKELLDRMRVDLKLSDEQYNRIDKALEESRENWKVLWDIMGPEIRTEMQYVRNAIHEELDPEQRRQFDRIQQLQQQRLRKNQQFQPQDGPRPGNALPPLQPGQGDQRFRPNGPNRWPPLNPDGTRPPLPPPNRNPDGDTPR